MTAQSGGDPLFLTALGAVTQRLGLGAVQAASLLRLTGGASQETWTFDTVDGAGAAHALILRRLNPDVPFLEGSIGPEVEAALMRTAGEWGVPEPRVHHILTPQDGLGRGAISQRVDGETLARKILRDALFAPVRPRLASMCGAALARIHAIDPACLPALPVQTASFQLAAARRYYATAGRRSAPLELAFRWLQDHVPPEPDVPRLVHGDFRHGNLIIGPDGVRAVLDWEMAHLGDPAEDLGWITVNSWRFGHRDLPVGGFGSVDQMLAGYASAGGAQIAIDHILFWRALGSLRWAIGCLQMAQEPAEGGGMTVERAMIGRRVSECELDLLDILAPEPAA